MGQNPFVIVDEAYYLLVLLHLVLDFCVGWWLLSCEEFNEFPELFAIVFDDRAREVGYLGSEDVVVEPFSGVVCTLEEDVGFNGIIAEDILCRSRNMGSLRNNTRRIIIIIFFFCHKIIIVVGNHIFFDLNWFCLCLLDLEHVLGCSLDVGIIGEDAVISGSRDHDAVHLVVESEEIDSLGE